MILRSEKRRLAGIDCHESKAPLGASKAPSRVAIAVTHEGLQRSLSSGSDEKIVDFENLPGQNCGTVVEPFPARVRLKRRTGCSEHLFSGNASRY
jgi:hypothetical protein